VIEPGAIHLMQWIEANAQAFLPPVANKEVFPESEFIFQIIRGPSAGTPHCPIRPPATWGLVIERKRRPDELDRLAWFCDRCQVKLHEVAFTCEDIEAQLREAIQTFNASPSLRTCQACGAVLPVPVGAR